MNTITKTIATFTAAAVAWALPARAQSPESNAPTAKQQLLSLPLQFPFGEPGKLDASQLVTFREAATCAAQRLGINISDAGVIDAKNVLSQYHSIPDTDDYFSGESQVEIHGVRQPGQTYPPLIFQVSARVGGNKDLSVKEAIALQFIDGSVDGLKPQNQIVTIEESTSSPEINRAIRGTHDLIDSLNSARVDLYINYEKWFYKAGEHPPGYSASEEIHGLGQTTLISSADPASQTLDGTSHTKTAKATHGYGPIPISSDQTGKFISDVTTAIGIVRGCKLIHEFSPR